MTDDDFISLQYFETTEFFKQRQLLTKNWSKIRISNQGKENSKRFPIFDISENSLQKIMTS